MINNLDVLKQDLPYIYNINNFLVTPEKYHPDNPKYIKQWNTYKKHYIEGLWAYDQHHWRFMPASLFAYGNFFKMEDQDNKQRIIIKPMVRDVDWLIHYEYLVACGFSGFEKDDKYTADIALTDERMLKQIKHSNVSWDIKRYANLHKSNGTYKEYIPATAYIKETKSGEFGTCLYDNPASNMLIFGARGSGKSYSMAGIICKEMTVDGLKYYTQEELNKKPKINVLVGAAVTDKSSELIDKVVKNMGYLGSDPDFGCWGNPEDSDFIPGPFYVDWIGSTQPNNSKNPYRYEYRVETPAGWQTQGSGTKLLHVNYSEKKAGGEAAGAGSRNGLVVYEEIGLMPNFRDALLSNRSTVTHNGYQFAPQVGLGTSGNIDLVQQTKLVFNSPEVYNVIPHDNIWEPSETKIGLFLPAYLSDRRFKDLSGNTDLKMALEHYVVQREKDAKKDDIEVIRFNKMNDPLIPSDMWQSSKGSYFPVTELLDIEQDLVRNQKYKKTGKPVKFIWDTTKQYGVRADYDEEAEPYYNFPFDRSMSKPDGCPIIFEEPNYVKGEIPKDMYIYTFDPYVSENIEEGGSLGCFQIWLNRKYTREGFNGDQLVATYYGKNPNGKDAYYEIMEKMIAYYGNCPRMLWYEANRGDSVRGYFMRKNKLNLLALRPTREKGSSAVERKVQEFGYMVNNKIDKLNMITDAAEWLLSFTQRNGKQVRVYETIPCLFTVQQLIQYTLEGNFDAVSALLGLPLALKEFEHILLNEIEKNTKKKNPLAFISVNPNIFRHERKYAT